MELAIGVMGASRVDTPAVGAKAEIMGAAVARHGAWLITGATTGYPLLAAKAAKKAGGRVLGFSPALTADQHAQLGLPFDHHDLIVYTGLSFKGRNLLNVRASQGLIFIGGSMGALNEFTIAYDEEKILGILEGTGGFCDRMRDWISCLEKPGNGAILHFDDRPEELVDRVVRSVASRMPKT